MSGDTNHIGLYKISPYVGCINYIFPTHSVGKMNFELGSIHYTVYVHIGRHLHETYVYHKYTQTQQNLL